MQHQLKKFYRYAGTVQVGKFSAVVVDSTIYPDGFALPPSGMNASRVIGIVREAILDPFSSGSSGPYEISQLPWGLNMNPPTPQGMLREVVYMGLIRARAAGAWSRGDRLIVANNLGQLASVVTLRLPLGTQINVVAIAEEPASNVGDTVQVNVAIKTETV